MRHTLALTLFLVGCSNAGSDGGASSDTDGLTEGTGSGSTSSASEGPASDVTGPPTTTGEGPTSDGTSTSSDATGPTTDPTTGDPTATATGGTSTTSDDTTGEPAGGCGKEPGFRGDMALKITVADVERDYILVVPPDYDPNKSYPLVFAWHGRGSNGAQARLYFKVEEASAGEAIFIYPDGLPLADMQDQTGWDLDPANEDFALFDALLADALNNLCVDPGRVFSTGHSFGGYMSIQLACFRADALRGIGEVAGGGPFAINPCSGQVAAWMAHGTLDMVVPYAEGEKARDHMVETNNCDAATDPVDPAPCVAYTGCDDGAPVHWCSHDIAEFMGHTWPSWAGEGIWNFFAAL